MHVKGAVGIIVLDELYYTEIIFVNGIEFELLVRFENFVCDIAYKGVRLFFRFYSDKVSKQLVLRQIIVVRMSGDSQAFSIAINRLNFT